MSRGKAPAFQWYAKDWLTDDRRVEMSVAQRGCYADLLSYQWVNGAIPDDPTILARIVGLPTDEMAALFVGRLADSFPVGRDGQRRNKRLERERETLDAYKERQRAAGKKGAQKRQEVRVANDSPQGSPEPKVSSSFAFASASATDTEAKASDAGASEGIPVSREDVAWKAHAAQTLRANGVPPKQVGDAIKNWWGPVRQHLTDDEITALVTERGKQITGPWNPAQLWNVRNPDTVTRLRYHIGRMQKAGVGDYARRVAR